MGSNSLSRTIILICISIIAVSIGYYYLIFLPQKERTRTADEGEERILSIKNDCIDTVLKDLKSINPNMETTEITQFRTRGDISCYIEAGCIGDPEISNDKPKFETCNKSYYDTCLAGVKKQVENLIEAEKSKRIDECVELYSK